MSVLARLLLAGLVTLVLAAPAAASTAPGAPGTDEQFLPADKSGLATATTLASTTWATVQKEGGLGEIYYPDLGTPSARALQFMVADGAGHATLVRGMQTQQTDGSSLSYEQTASGPGWQLSVRYATDPQRPTVVADVGFSGSGFTLYAVYDPALSNTRDDDRGATDGATLTATDGTSASALAAHPDFAATSNGERPTSDGWTDLLADGRMDWHYTDAPAGNLVQTAQVALDGRGHATLALGFAADVKTAASNARASRQAGFATLSSAYADGWHGYLASLKAAPATASPRLYRTSAMVLAASEDKRHRGAYVASPTMPWIWGHEAPSGPYHLVWSRDLYQIATALIAAGDTGGANRALDFLFNHQQKSDGSFPQNSDVTGTPVWGGLQLDEVGFPIVLAHQLGRTDAGTWSHVKRAADFLVNFVGDHPAPWSPQDRWENQSGYSPATIAAEIAGLVCAADLAKANGDNASATKYLKTADAWQSKVKDWTVTTTGPYSSGPYFLRLTKDGDPNAGTTYNIGDSGPTDVDQRKVVDPSFLDLVRLGVLPAKDPAILNSLNVIDAQLAVATANGTFWHRASFDGYGEKRDGSQWEFGLPDNSLTTLGRAWPLLNGERGEWALAAGSPSSAATQLQAMTRAAGPGAMLPEQVWDRRPPADGSDPAFVPGTPTFSATPLAWTHAQYIRLAWDAAAGKVLEQPAVVAARYAKTK